MVGRVRTQVCTSFSVAETLQYSLRRGIYPVRKDIIPQTRSQPVIAPPDRANGTVGHRSWNLLYDRAGQV
jgi:hypothetical protein